MKPALFIICLAILSNEINSKFLRSLQSSTNTYDYSSISAKSTNQDLTSVTVSSETQDESVVYITNSGIEIKDSTLSKNSGDSSNTENSEFYGVNAAVLVQGGGVTISGGTISTKAKGANALCATNKGTVQISGTTITSTGESSARGLHATYGGSISASGVKVSSTGGSCATLATDRGEGTVTCSGCTLSTAGAGSPLIYSTGQITVSDSTTGTSTGAQAVVVEGKNTATVKNSELKCYGYGNRGSTNTSDKVDKCGVMLYQSMSGDADSGTSTFNCESSTIEIVSGSSVYSSAPMFFITNTDAAINLNNCQFNYASLIFLSAEGTSEWGTSGSNGGVVTLTLKNQNIEGNFVVDASSGLTINLTENSKIKGKINNGKTAAKIEITLDSTSSIELTGDSYYTSLTNSGSSNIETGGYKWEQVESSEISQGGSGGSGGSTPPGGSTRPGGSTLPGGPGDSGERPEMPGGTNQPPSNSRNTNTTTSKSNYITISILLLLFALF